MTITVLTRQAWIAPAAMLLPMAAGVITPEHNSLSQHMSALTLLDGWPPLAVTLGAGLCGLSLLLFAGGCLVLTGALRWSYTALACLAFGLAMVFNALFPMGSPLHGLYGLAIFSVLVPAFFVAEFGQRYLQPWLVPFSLLISLLSLAYMWLLLVGLDPPETMGLTQRVFTLVSFGWYAVVARLQLV